LAQPTSHLARLAAFAALAAIVIVVAAKIRYGLASDPFVFTSTSPVMPAEALELVAELPEPPSNVAVSADGRIFFTHHPDAGSAQKVVEWVGGQTVPFPDAAFQEPRDDGQPYFDTPFSVRIDDQQRLWVLDAGANGMRQARLLSFDLRTRSTVHRWDIPPDIAGLGSTLQDFHVDRDGRYVYIADLSAIRLRPAVIVYDVQTRSARRLLEGQAGVSGTRFVVNVKGQPLIRLGGLVHVNAGINPIALDHHGEWLYFGAISGDRLFRIRTADLRDEQFSAAALAARVEDYGPKNQSDGMTIDSAGNIYLAGVGQGTVDQLTPSRELRTYIRSSRLRWPDGMGFAPDGWVYLADSDFAGILFQSRSHIHANGPYALYRFRAEQKGRVGH
jgi:sugar lactone lactonase YvrE